MVACIDVGMSRMLSSIADSVHTMKTIPGSIGERVRYAREQSGLSALELARSVGVTRSAIYQIESGTTRSPTPQTLWAIARATGHSPEWLISGNGVPNAARKIMGAAEPSVGQGSFATIRQFIHVKRVEVAEKLGQYVWFTSPDNPLPIPVEILSELEISEDDAIAITVHDDSMAPTICRGDTLLVDASDRRISQGRVLATLYMGEVLLRRTHIEPDGTLALIADSDRWPDIRVPHELQSSISVIGRVRYRMGKVEL